MKMGTLPPNRRWRKTDLRTGEKRRALRAAEHDRIGSDFAGDPRDRIAGPAGHQLGEVRRLRQAVAMAQELLKSTPPAGPSGDHVRRTGQRWTACTANRTALTADDGWMLAARSAPLAAAHDPAAGGRVGSSPISPAPPSWVPSSRGLAVRHLGRRHEATQTGSDRRCDRTGPGQAGVAIVFGGIAQAGVGALRALDRRLNASQPPLPARDE